MIDRKINHNQQAVNEVILHSIPMNKQMKRFFIRKFVRMVRDNGQSYACDKFKNLKETLCGFRSDPQRIAHTDAWLKRSGFKRTGWLKMLFHYMETQPQNALQFVKLYCGPNDPIVTVGEAAESQHSALSEAEEVNTATPRFLSLWLHHIGRERKLSPELYQWLKSYWQTGKWSGPKAIQSGLLTASGLANVYMLAMPFGISSREWMRNFILNHSYDEYCNYVRKWKRLLWVSEIPEDRVNAQMGSVVPRAEMYVDYGKGSTKLEPKYSSSFDEDVWRFISMEGYLDLPKSEGGNGLTSADFDYLVSLLPSEVSLLYLDPDFSVPGVKKSILDGTYVGEIQHIPKKGTVKRRSIACLNRFIQMGLKPVDLQLESMLRNLGRVKDCTYDQSREDCYIENRVNNDNLYAGSVDLHQATDFLPFNWMLSIWKYLFEGRVSKLVESSWMLFVHASKGAWYNQGYRDSWTTGQPLGALPSFKCLAITHNLLLASLCFTLGYSHDPYVILGDDIVIMNKKVRKAYIHLMTNAKVPLSLNKSFEGAGVEFAGKWFFKNQAPFYNTDHRAITWNSLFDYQLATGIYIPYGNLPSKIRHKFAARVRAGGVPERYSASVYQIIVYSMMPARGSNVSMDRRSVDPKILGWFIANLESEDTNPEPDLSSGLTFLKGGHPVTFGRMEYANKDGWFQSYRKVEPGWFRDKYRPVTTDKLITIGCKTFIAFDND